MSFDISQFGFLTGYAVEKHTPECQVITEVVGDLRRANIKNEFRSRIFNSPCWSAVTEGCAITPTRGISLALYAGEVCLEKKTIQIKDCWCFTQYQPFGQTVREGIMRFLNTCFEATFVLPASSTGIARRSRLEVGYGISQSFSLLFEPDDISPMVSTPARSVTKVHTYIIESPRYECVKIGKSVDPKNRIKGNQTGNPDKLRLVGTLAGDYEGVLHRRFYKHRMEGEWFAAAPVLTWWEAEGKKGRISL